MREFVLIPCLTFLLGITSALAALADEYTETRSGILGTEFSFTIVGVTQGEAQQVTRDLLLEIERLERILSTYQASELMQLNAEGLAKPFSPELAEVLRLCEDWREKTANAFSCRLGGLLDTWRKAGESGELPDRTALRKTARALGSLERDALLANSNKPAVQWEPSGVAKGFIIDAALATARRRAPTATGIKIDMGGDVVYWGTNGQRQPWHVAVTDPQHGADNDGYNAVIAVTSRAVAYSGHSRRYREIDGRRFSHILNPDDGWPINFAPSAVVIADDATTADALATALTVMPIADGLALIKRLPKVEALIMTESGKTFASDGWYASLIPDELHQPLWDDDMQFLVEYEIPALTVAAYRRPYAAVWITDADKNLVRQLLVHGKSLRWLREIPLWWRRYGRRDESMIDGLARPTPAPGQHLLVWDGRDDRGRKVGKGQYVMNLEIAREHGERELVSVPFELSGQAFSHQTKGTNEVGLVKVRFKPKP